MDVAEAALHVRRIQNLVEQQWECLRGGRVPGEDMALEHPDSRVNKLQQEIRSLVHTLASYYNHGGADPEGASQSIVKSDGRARTSSNLQLAGVNSGFETTPDVDPESRSHAKANDSATQPHPDGPVPSEHTMETDRAHGDPSPIPGMMEGTAVMGGTRTGPEPEDEIISKQEAEVVERKLDLSTEQPMEAEPQPNRDSEAVDGEFIAACHFLKDHMDNMDNPNDEMRRTLVVLFQVWFRVAAEEDSTANQVAVILREVRTATPSLLPFLVNMADDNGNTAVHYSVSHTNYAIVSLLLDTGVCEVDLQNKAGYTAVMLASLTAPGDPGDMDVVRRLMELGDVNARASQGGQTALMLAVRHGRAIMVRLLLRCRADPNVQDHQGATALMYACQRAHTHIVRLLLDRADCDTSLTDRRGHTALTVAQQGSHADITSLLQAHHTYAGTSL
ncbi:hypothetical protein UPYG_G00300480 [Umbra pygmaea]|uniref:Uncharacterized protein n=1 Tax=Umbra pygmaea TaxID=75934 RepID=A0ABD0WB04_UMBPY